MWGINELEENDWISEEFSAVLIFPPAGGQMVELNPRVRGG